MPLTSWRFGGFGRSSRAAQVPHTSQAASQGKPCLVTGATTPGPAPSPRGGQGRGPGGGSATFGHSDLLSGAHHPQVGWGLPHGLLPRSHHHCPWAPWQPLTPGPHFAGHASSNSSHPSQFRHCSDPLAGAQWPHSN